MKSAVEDFRSMYHVTAHRTFSRADRGEHTPRTLGECGHYSRLVTSRLAFRKSQISTVESELPDARSLPSGEKATEETASLCPERQAISVPDNASSKRTVLSQHPAASVFPSDEKAIA